MTPEARLRSLLMRTRNYLDHHPGCRAKTPWPRDEGCSCGLRELYERLELERVSQWLREAG